MSIKLPNIKIESYICPWVLPNEEIPAYIIWDKDFEFNDIKIEIPDDLTLVKFINIENYHQENNLFIFHKEMVKNHDVNKNYPCFFGIIFEFKNLNFDALKISKEIKIRFYKGSEIIYEFPLTAKIFRPKLDNISEIEPVDLIDQRNDYKINLNFQCKGFGFVSTSIEVEINKMKFTFDDSIFSRVYKKLKIKYEEVIKENSDDSSFEVTQKLKKKIKPESVIKFLNIIEKFTHEENQLNHEIIKEFEDENVDVYLVIDFIVEVVEEVKIRYKNENVLLNTPVLELPKESFDEFISKIKLFIHYEDLKGNKYSPLTLELMVNDKRSHPQQTKINFIVNVDKIEDHTFKDIENVR